LRRTISVEEAFQKPIEEREVEIVERKGKGHPDYISDGSAEAVSRALCLFYREKFGTVLHHNVDKGLVVGGKAHPVFGGGKIIEPINVIVAGRAVTEVFDGKKSTTVPIDTVSTDAIRVFLRESLRFLDIDKHVVIKCMIKQGSSDLINVFNRDTIMPLANDSSFGVGFAPLSQLERLVFETEQYLNSPKLKKVLPEVGEDIKVMGLRKNKNIRLTIAAAIVSGLTPDKDHYLNVKEEIKNRIADLATKTTGKPVEIYVNAADNPKTDSYYLTVTGTSAEQGDDGNTGRGNRVNGLITPFRPMSLEATAGKNPVNHVGKLYNLLAKLTAEKMYNEVKGIKEVYVTILSKIGMSIDEPATAYVQLILDKGVILKQISNEVSGILDEQLNGIRKVTDMIINGKAMLF